MAARRSGSRLRRLTQIVAMAVAAILVGNGSAAQLSASVAGVEWLTFRNATLGLSFTYPAGWVATAGCHGSRTCVGISEGKRGVDDYTLALEVFPGGLERVAIDKAVFRPRPGGWVAHGRSSEHPVETVDGEGWRGLQAVVDCGISDRSIMHAAAGECLWTVLSDGSISVVADTQGSNPITEVVRRIIRSVRFVRQ